MKTKRVSKVWVRCLYNEFKLYWFTPIQKFKVTCKNADFECQYINEKPQISSIRHVVLSLIKILQTKMLFWVLWSLLLLMNSSDLLQNGSFQQNENLEFVNLIVCYLHTIIFMYPYTCLRRLNWMHFVIGYNVLLHWI